MKKRAFALLLALVMAMGTVTGCSSPEDTISKIGNETTAENRSEGDWVKLIEAYAELDNMDEAFSELYAAKKYYPDSSKLQKLADEYLDAAPVPEIAPGTYKGRTEVVFSGEAYKDGQLYVMVGYEEPESGYFWQVETDSAVSDDGLTVFKYPSAGSFCVDLYTAGTHQVKAFVVKDGTLSSQVFEGEYIINGANFSDFAVYEKSDEYNDSVEVTFTGATGTIYYTLDGTDPLKVNSIGKAGFSDDAMKADGNKVKITKTCELNARCKGADGLISPLLTEEYRIKVRFDANTSSVDEDFSRYDYVCDRDDGIFRFDKLTGEKKQISSYPTTHIAAFYANGDADDYTSDTTTLHPEAFSVIEEGENIWLMARRTDNNVYRALVVNGNPGEWDLRIQDDIVMETFYFDRVGEGWFWNNMIDPFWCSDKPEYGDPAIAKKVSLLLDNMGVYVKNDGSKKYPKYAVYACDSNGKNDRLLWESGEQRPYLDAMTDKIILYNYESNGTYKHMVYHLNSGKHTENTVLPSHARLKGYTSTAAYTDQAGIVRYEIDYNAF